MKILTKIVYPLVFWCVVFASLFFIWRQIFSESEPGYVLIGIGHWQLEASLASFTIAMWVVFLCLYAIFRLLGWLMQMPSKAKTKNQHLKVNRSQDALVSGLVDNVEGKWERAEKTLIKHAPSSSAPLIHYLTAARAAQSRGAIENRDQYLNLATKQSPGSDLAIGLTRAELCLAQKQYEQALEELNKLQTKNPADINVLSLLYQTYQQQGDWQAIKTLLPMLEANQVLDASELEALQIDSTTELFSRINSENSAEDVIDIWEPLPENIQQLRKMEMQFYAAMIVVGAGDSIEQDIVLALARDWDDRDTVLFGSIQSQDAEKQLQVAEQWAELHPRDAVLMRVLGKLNIKAGDFERADTCLSKSISLAPSVAAYQLLGELVFAQGDHQRASELYKSGLELASSAVIDLVERNDKVNIPIIDPPVQTPIVESDLVEPSQVNPGQGIEPNIVTKTENTIAPEPVTDIDVAVASPTVVTEGIDQAGTTIAEPSIEQQPQALESQETEALESMKKAMLGVTEAVAEVALQVESTIAEEEMVLATESTPEPAQTSEPITELNPEATPVVEEAPAIISDQVDVNTEVDVNILEPTQAPEALTELVQEPTSETESSTVSVTESLAKEPLSESVMESAPEVTLSGESPLTSAAEIVAEKPEPESALMDSAEATKAEEQTPDGSESSKPEKKTKQFMGFFKKG